MKFVNKQNLSGIIFLIFLIVICQIGGIESIFENWISRLILLVYLICLSITNKNFALLSVFILVVLFSANKSMIETMENHQTTNKSNIQPKKNNNKLFKSIEGFDLLGKEHSLQKGKQSSCLPVNKEKNHDIDSVIPLESDKYNTSF